MKKFLFTLFVLLPNLAGANESEEVVVVGAGIVGASIAYHLADAGLSVTVLEKEAPASHASQGTFAWLNASWAKQPQSYHQLNQQSVAYWHQLSDKLDIPVKWGGSLEWFGSKERAIKLQKQIAEQQQWGEPAKILNAAEAKQLESNIEFPADAVVAYSGNDGALDPKLATDIMLDAAQHKGAKLRFPCTVTQIKNKVRPIVVESSCGSFTTAKVVLAVGANSDLIKSATNLDIPQRTTPGIIAVTKPLPKLLTRVIAGPGIHMHQRLDGRVVIGEQSGAPATHQERLAQRPNRYPSKEFEQQHFQRMIDIAKTLVPVLTNAELDQMFIGWRPLPLDGHPVLGFGDEKQTTYIAVMHSGVTLAPLVGKLVTQEIQGVTVEQLDDYRPSREFKIIKRY